MIELNNGAGVFGTMDQNPVETEGMEMALKQEIKEGPVQIITTIDGNGPQVYEAEIEKLNMIEDSPSKNMVLHITDERLLEKTGGIVQGMSGSPDCTRWQIDRCSDPCFCQRSDKRLWNLY